MNGLDKNITITAPHAAALAVYHASARYLPRTESREPLARVARKLDSEAFELAVSEEDVERVSDALSMAISQVRSVGVAGREVDTVLRVLKAFLTKLRSVPEGSRNHECVIDGLIKEVETNVRHAYAKVSSSVKVSISYGVSFVQRKDPKSSDSQRFIARTESLGAKKYVNLTLYNESFTGDDLNALVYVLFHELVCHALQGAEGQSSAGGGGQHGWSEGWMDSIALEMARDWMKGPSSNAFVATAGTGGTSPMELEHGKRMRGRHSLQLARDAYGRLEQAFARRRLDGHDQASIREFSLAVNVLGDARAEKLEELNAALQAAMTTDAPAPDTAAASSCQAFYESRKLDLLINDLRSLRVSVVAPDLTP